VYTQLTNFSDSVVAPALSPDGRMLAFIRGENTFDGPGEVYVKLLPNGEPAQLTHDDRNKMGPTVFSPDGSQVVYTVNTAQAWSVPVLGGQAAPLIANAGALTWLKPGSDGRRRVMFSALTGEGINMGIFSAEASRADQRRIYLPADVNGMAHRSFASPDGRSVLVVEMDLTGWRPCRLVPADGSTQGTQIGPLPSQCTDAAWSPDGTWMYVAANSGDGFHIWRQPFPAGPPEQVTSGATEEQGIAFAADGGSFVTSIGDRQSTLWVHAGDTRQVTFEASATPRCSQRTERACTPRGIAGAAEVLGARAIPDDRAYVSDDPSVYAFPRVSTHRNIYRVSVR
jgi:Tol biopolymer transport system component